MSNLQYLVVSDTTEKRGDMDGEYSFLNFGDASAKAYELYKSNFGICAIVAFNYDTGNICLNQSRNREQIKQLMWQFEEAEHNEEAGEARHGSYVDQHSLRTQDVLGRA